MTDAECAAFVLQLYQTVKLSMRQIAVQCGMGRKTVSRIIAAQGAPVRQTDQELLLTPYRRLIESWYAEYPQTKPHSKKQSSNLMRTAAKRANFAPGWISCSRLYRGGGNAASPFQWRF